MSSREQLGRHLKAPGVRQHAARPVDEAVKASHFSNEVRSGPELKMVGIAEDNVAVEIFQLFAREPLDGSYDGMGAQGSNGLLVSSIA